MTSDMTSGPSVPWQPAAAAASSSSAAAAAAAV